MARAMKIFSGSVYKGSKHYTCILATTTKKRACEILKVSASELRNYWYCWELDGCGQDHVKKQALAQPETPLYCYDREHFKREVTYRTLEEIEKE